METINSQDRLARDVVDQMMQDDAFSRWLNIQLLEVRAGYSRLQMELRPDMCNGLGTIHGGALFSLADSAFAFACNNRNNRSVALDTAMNFTKPGKAGDTVTAEAQELHNGRSTGLYLITLFNGAGEQMALFKGTCFRTGQPLV